MVELFSRAAARSGTSLPKSWDFTRFREPCAAAPASPVQPRRAKGRHAPPLLRLADSPLRQALRGLGAGRDLLRRKLGVPAPARSAAAGDDGRPSQASLALCPGLH